MAHLLRTFFSMLPTTARSPFNLAATAAHIRTALPTAAHLFSGHTASSARSRFVLVAASLLLIGIPAAHADSVIDPPLNTQQAAANTVFIEEAARLRGNSAALKVGQAVTPFVLYDQSSTPVEVPTTFKGQYIVVSFIFTRCLVATMCPAATSKMVSLQRELAEAGLADKVQLVSITFDPRYDTPAVMQRYAQMFGADTTNYAFLTGDEKLNSAILRRFGILTRDANDTIVHTMTTSLIGTDGALALQERGADWQAQTFFDFIKAHSAK